MYISSRMARVRNVSVAAVNGTITLIILLIAPLGLAAVIINTVLVTIASYTTATAADRITRYLTAKSQPIQLGIHSEQGKIQRRPDSGDIDRIP